MSDVGSVTETSMNIERRSVSWPQLIGYGIIIAVQAFAAGGVWIGFTSRMDSQEQKLVAQDLKLNDAQNTITAVKTQNEVLPTIVYRLGQNEARDDAQDARIDSIMAGINGKLDAIREDVGAVKDDVGSVKSDVRVLTERVDLSLQSKQSRSRAKPLAAVPKPETEL